MTTMETPQSANLREYCGWTGNTEDDMYGYDEDPKKQELLEHIHADINGEAWLMVWDCFAHEFTTDMKENQK